MAKGGNATARAGRLGGAAKASSEPIVARPPGTAIATVGLAQIACWRNHNGRARTVALASTRTLSRATSARRLRTARACARARA